MTEYTIDKAPRALATSQTEPKNQGKRHTPALLPVSEDSRATPALSCPGGMVDREVGDDDT